MNIWVISITEVLQSMHLALFMLNNRKEVTDEINLLHSNGVNSAA